LYSRLKSPDLVILYRLYTNVASRENGLGALSANVTFAPMAALLALLMTVERTLAFSRCGCIGDFCVVS